MRTFRHDRMQQQQGGEAVLDDTVDVKSAKHYLVFIATGLGAEKFQLLCGRFGLESVNAKALSELTTQVLTELLDIGGLHAQTLSYDAAQENVCEYECHVPPSTPTAQCRVAQSLTIRNAQQWQPRCRVSDA